MPATHNMIEVANDENCDRDCVECLPQFATAKPVPTVAQHLLVQQLSDSAATKLAADFARQIETDRKYLIDKLACYGDAVASRWKKKSKEKRVSAILKAQPGLYKEKLPELRSHFGNDNFEGNTKSAFLVNADDTDRLARAYTYLDTSKNALLLPYLTVEVLKDDPNKLLSLLHFRTAYTPDQWVMFDVAQMKHGAENGTLSRRYNPNCLIMYGEQYGKFVLWDRTQCHRWHYIGFPRAILVLEAQALLLSFLRTMVDLIVVPGSGGKLVQNPAVLPPTGFKASGQVEFWSPMANGAFSPPPTFDPLETFQQVQAQLAAAEDHLYLLQADPAYIHGILTKQKRVELFAKASPEQLWDVLVGDLMVYPITHVHRLRDLVDECKHVVAMHERYHKDVALGSALPEQYERSLMGLELLCINLYLAQSKRLPDLLPKSAGFSRNYKYVPMGYGRVGHTLRMIGDTTRSDYSVNKAYYQLEPLHFALLMLEQNPQDDNAFNIPFLMSFIDEHLANADDKERARIDQALYDHLARMSVYAEIWVKLRMHRPAANSIPCNYDALTDDEKKRRTWTDWRNTPSNATNAENDELSQHLKDFYEGGVPTGKHDQKWMAGVKTARAALSRFWAIARKVRQREVSGIGFSEQYLKEDAELFSAETSPRYSADLADELASLVLNHNRVAIDAERYTPQTEWGATPDDKILDPAAVKIKTRPKHDVTSSTVSSAEEVEAQSSTTTRIPVNSGSLRIFGKMFPGGTEEAYKGIVKWQHFVTAMVDAGCSAQHIGGSMVNFTVPDARETGGRIVFHRPHPEHEVGLVMLRAMGKRMANRFGWERGVFVERVKNSK